MRPAIVDSNVILDVAQSNSRWSAWSTGAIKRLLDVTVLVINPIIYAEVSIGYRTIEDVEVAMPADL